MCVSSWVDWTAAVQHNAVVRAFYMISTEEWREEDKAVCGVGGGGVLPPPPPYFLQHLTRKSHHHHHHHTQNLPQEPQWCMYVVQSLNTTAVHCHRSIFPPKCQSFSWDFQLSQCIRMNTAWRLILVSAQFAKSLSLSKQMCVIWTDAVKCESES